jgi:hypothetical protein
MADEFAKGLGIATAAGLGWMVLAGWYKTHEFGSNRQLFQPAPDNLDIYGQLAMVLHDAMIVTMLLGPLVFWFLVPAVREARTSRESGS